MRRRPTAAALALVLGTWLSAPRTAHACSANRCGSPPRTIPADGAVDVPLNAELELLGPDDYFTLLRRPTQPSVRVAGTTDRLPIEPARTSGRVRVVGGLAPHTTYELLGPSRDPECLGATPDVVLATFTTGDASDTTPPSRPITTTGPCVVDADPASTCGGYLAATVHATWRATDDGALGIAYAFGTPHGSRLSREHGVAAQIVQMSGISAVVTFEPMPSEARVYAIDVAGNVSEPADLDLDLSCADALHLCDAGACSDDAGGPSEPGDAAALSFDGGARSGAAPTPGGCAASTRGSSIPVVILLVALVTRRLRSRA